jgi:DNA excision repair protein ERCC-4
VNALAGSLVHLAPLLFDHREAKSGIPAALIAAGVDVAPAQLPAGDYIVSDRLVVERKTGADLAASIKDRRLFEQTERLRAAYPAVVLLVEGEPIHISSASWKGALGRVLASGVAVLQTDDADDSAGWLVRLHRLEGKGPTEARGRPRIRRPADDLEPVAEDVLTCLPGVSTVGVRRLLAHFGSLSATLAAGEDELRQVPGIGPVRGAHLARLFHATFSRPE